MFSKSLFCSVIVFLCVTPLLAARAVPHVNEGDGYGRLKLGMTEDAVKALLGAPEQRNFTQQSSWLIYRKRFSIDILFVRNVAREIRFNVGFKNKLSSGTGIGTSLVTVKRIYGKPNAQFGDANNSIKLEYSEAGVLFWFLNGHVNQFVIFPKYTPRNLH